jgi:hypothetical protein
MNEFIALHPLGEGGIRWDSKLVKISLNSVYFENETCNDVDLVIGMENFCISLLYTEKTLSFTLPSKGCDGINSVARKFKYKIDNSLSFLGIMVVLGITGCDHMLGKVLFVFSILII